MKINKVSNSQLLSSLRSSSILDSVICDDEYLRCYKFYPEWGDGIQVATYENGGGDDLVIIFKNDSVVIKGFDHESEVSPHAQDEYGIWPGMYDGLPKDLMLELENEAFEKEDVTFCYWRTSEEGEWKQGPVVFNENEDNGSDWLLESILLTPNEYIEYGKDYYEEDFESISVEKINSTFNEGTS